MDVRECVLFLLHGLYTDHFIRNVGPRLTAKEAFQMSFNMKGGVIWKAKAGQ
jgi:hypothetical protein